LHSFYTLLYKELLWFNPILVTFLTNTDVIMVMRLEDSKNEKKPIEYNRIVVNVPVGLLKEFDKICSLKHYSRVEAVKEAMRIFVEENTPEDYLTYEESREQFESMWTGMYDSLLNIYNNPKYKQLREKDLIQPQTQFPQSTKKK